MGSPALVAKLAASQAVFAHVQAETKLLHPLGKRKAIKPDLRFSVDAPATNDGTIAIVEFKQRRELDVAHVSEVLAAYSLGVGLRGGVVLINYDAAPAVAVPLGCVLLGDVHPGSARLIMSNPTALVQSLWNYCDILRDDGLSFRLRFASTRQAGEYMEQRVSVVDELESVVSANLQRSVRLRQSILHKAFTEELV